MTVETLPEIRRPRPDRLGWLRTIVNLLTLVQIDGDALLLADALGGWLPRLPGGGGIFVRIDQGPLQQPREGRIEKRITKYK